MNEASFEQIKTAITQGLIQLFIAATMFGFFTSCTVSVGWHAGQALSNGIGIGD